MEISESSADSLWPLAHTKAFKKLAELINNDFLISKKPGDLTSLKKEAFQQAQDLLDFLKNYPAEPPHSRLLDIHRKALEELTTPSFAKFFIENVAEFWRLLHQELPQGVARTEAMKSQIKKMSFVNALANLPSQANQPSQAPISLASQPAQAAPMAAPSYNQGIQDKEVDEPALGTNFGAGALPGTVGALSQGNGDFNGARLDQRNSPSQLRAGDGHSVQNLLGYATGTNSRIHRAQQRMTALLIQHPRFTGPTSDVQLSELLRVCSDAGRQLAESCFYCSQPCGGPLLRYCPVLELHTWVFEQLKLAGEWQSARKLAYGRDDADNCVQDNWAPRGPGLYRLAHPESRKSHARRGSQN